MDTNDLQKQAEYIRVKADKTDNLQWVENVITDMYYAENSRLTTAEFTALLTSLDEGCEIE